MTMTPALRERYAGEVDVDWWESLILSHSLMPTYYLTSYHEDQTGLVDGVSQTFVAVPFRFEWPRSSDSGRGDISLSIGAVGNTIRESIEAALELPTERILAQFSVYIVGLSQPQYIPPIELSLTDIVVTEQQVAGVATHADNLNAPFPSQVYRGDAFPGLVRR